MSEDNIKKLMSVIGVPRSEVERRIKRKIEDLKGLINEESAILLLMKEQGMDVPIKPPPTRVDVKVVNEDLEPQFKKRLDRIIYGEYEGKELIYQRRPLKTRMKIIEVDGKFFVQIPENLVDNFDWPSTEPRDGLELECEILIDGGNCWGLMYHEV